MNIFLSWRNDRRGAIPVAAMIALFVFLFVCAGFVGYWYGMRNKSEPTSSYETELPSATVTKSTPDSTKPLDTTPAKVTWQKPQKISSLKLFAPMTVPNNPGSEYESDYILNTEKSVTYYKVGQLQDSRGTADIVYIKGSNQAMDGGSEFVALSYPNGVVILGKYGYVSMDSKGKYTYEGLDRSTFSFDPAYTIADLEYPKTLVGSNPRMKLAYVASENMYDGAKPLDQVAFNDPTWGQVSISQNGVFYVSKSTLSTALYTLKPDFYDEDGLVPQVTFNDGSKNTAEYAYTAATGCGSGIYMQVVDAAAAQMSDLVQVGVNNKGDAMYVLKDTNHQILKNLYKNYHSDPEPSYQDFIKSRPLLFWVDPFGRLIELQNVKYAPEAECGKPVIYLYPEKTTAVSVKLAPKGGFTYTEPAYNDGWNVVAEPNGALHAKGGATYPYLFWEGRGKNYETPSRGWVVAKERVEGFLDDTLAKLGLNTKEAADFKEFWLPRMQEKPYYFITFMGNATMDELAPLTVVPHPDTVIRVLMDYKPLDAPISVEPYVLRTPERNGFTVVEWGGVLRK